MKYSEKVLIEPVKEKTGRTSTANQHHRDNVNAAQGPGHGNTGTPAKRSSFKSAKAEREPVAASIMAAYGARTPADHVETRLEPIRSTVKPKKFAR